MGLQLLDRGVRRPVRELPLRQSFVAHPKTLTVIRQNFHRRTPPIAEDEEPATEWIDLKLRPADPCQAINAGAKVDARHRHQNAHLRGELDHGNADQPDRHNCSTISVAAPGAISSCSLCPFAFCNDSRQPLGLTGNAPLNSMNFIGSGFDGRLALPGTRPITPLIPLSLLYSRPSARAVTYTPCRRATRPAADHTAAENATPRAWLPRHSSNRCRIRTKSRGCPAAPLARLAISCSHHRQSVWAPHYQPEPTSVTHAHRKDTNDRVPQARAAALSHELFSPRQILRTQIHLSVRRRGPVVSSGHLVLGRWHVARHQRAICGACPGGILGRRARQCASRADAPGAARAAAASAD